MKNTTKHRPITERDVKRVLKPIVESVLNENGEMLDTNEVKAVLNYVNAMAGGSSLTYATNNATVKKLERQISDLRVQLMQYVEDNSNYKFIGKSPNGWKLVKK